MVKRPTPGTKIGLSQGELPEVLGLLDRQTSVYQESQISKFDNESIDRQSQTIIDTAFRIVDALMNFEDVRSPYFQIVVQVMLQRFKKIQSISEEIGDYYTHEEVNKVISIISKFQNRF